MSVPAHVLPETSSAERLHILDKTCWCGPTERAVPKWQIIHKKAPPVYYRPIGHDGRMPDDGEPL